MSDTHYEMMQQWIHTIGLLHSDPQMSDRLKGFVSLAQPQALVGNVLLIAVPNEYTRDLFQSKMKDPFKKALQAAFGSEISEAFLINESLSAQSAEPAQPVIEPTVGDEQIPNFSPVEPHPGVPSYTNQPADTQLDLHLRANTPTHAAPHTVETEFHNAASVTAAIPGTPSHSSTAAAPTVADKPDANDLAQQLPLDSAIPDPSIPPVTGWESSARLNPNYTFDTFVIGQSNRFAHAAAFAVSESPANTYNPLFIYGDSGLGKTHLLHAIGHYAKHLYPSLRVRYVNSEEFTNDFINSIRDDEGSSFKQIYRNVDMLLIDDIQFLAGKEHTQEEFFHTFNALHNHQKQVVITSDLPPKQLTGFAERMRSRFEWGLITDVQPPELETRIAILRKKAQSESLNVPGDVMEYIASHITANIRELEGALIRVTAFSSLNKQPVDLSLAEVVLKDLITDAGGAEITAAQVLATTASYFDVSIDDLRSKSRTRTLTNARQIAMYLLRELTDMSLPRIGQELGGRDHTTVMHAVRKVSSQMPERHVTFNQVTELTNKIKQDQRENK